MCLFLNWVGMFWVFYFWMNEKKVDEVFEFFKLLKDGDILLIVGEKLVLEKWYSEVVNGEYSRLFSE